MEEGQSSAKKRARATQDDAGTEQQGGTHLVVLIDESGSMQPQGTTMLPAIESALRAVARNTPSPDTRTVKVFAFADAKPVLRLMWTNSLGAVLAAEGLGPGVRYVPDGTTALYDALVAALEHCARGATLLVATDGDDTCSTRNVQDAQEALACARAERGIKVLFLAEGVGARNEAATLGVPVMEVHAAAEGGGAGAEMSLSQALVHPEVHQVLSQSMAME